MSSLLEQADTPYTPLEATSLRDGDSIGLHESDLPPTNELGAALAAAASFAVSSHNREKRPRSPEEVAAKAIRDLGHTLDLMRRNTASDVAPASGADEARIHAAAAATEAQGRE